MPPSPGSLPPAIAVACDHLRRHADRAVTLAELAGVTGLSRAHLQRAFTAAVGCSPKAWHRAWRERRLREELRGGGGVEPAIAGAGYGSASRVYEGGASRLGMTPGQYARGGAGVAISWACAPCALGLVLVAASDRGVCWVALGDEAEGLLAELRAEFPAAALAPMPAAGRGAFQVWMDLVLAAVAGRADAAAPLAPRGTVFQLLVWEALRAIPAGRTRTYAELAAALGRPRAARAVAAACAANPLAVLVPCHRVVRGDGGLAGYRWGVGRKRALLAREGALRPRA